MGIVRAGVAVGQFGRGGRLGLGDGMAAFDGKVAIVTGGTRGIGRAIAAGLVGAGASVVVAGRRAETVEAAVAELGSGAAGRVRGVVADVRRPEECGRLVAEAVGAFGRLDIVVANAGGPPTGLFEELGEEAWQLALDQNLLSAVRLVREALPHLRRSGSGRVIAITSIAVKQPLDRLVLSNSARLGVVGLAKTLSRELGPYGITVNTVCPGFIATERLMTLLEERARRAGVSLEEVVRREEAHVPLGYLGEAEDVANLVVFLASEKARYISGTTVQVDGGGTVAVF